MKYRESDSTIDSIVMIIIKFEENWFLSIEKANIGVSK